MARSRRKRAVTSLALCVGAVAVTVAATQFERTRDMLTRLELAVQDAIIRTSERPPPPGNIIFLGIDEESITLDTLWDEEIAASSTLAAMKEGFPWSRRVHAAAIRKLCEAGARVVALDVLFPTPRAGDPDGDAELAFTLEDYADRVVLGGVFSTSQEGGTARSRKAGSVTWHPPSDELLATDGPDQRVGFVQFWPDLDDTVRRAHYQMTPSGSNGFEPRPGEPVYPALSTAILKQTGQGERVPEGTGGRRLRFLDASPEWGGDGVNPYPVHSIYKIFVPEFWESNFRGGAVFKDAIVMIGPTAGAFQDFHATPLGRMQGPQLHLTALACAQHGWFMDDWSVFGTGFWLFSLVASAAFAWVICVFSPRPLLTALILILLAPAAFVFASQVYTLKGVILPAALPMFVIYLGGGTSLTWDFTSTLIEKNRLHSTLSRYVSRNVAEAIVDQPDVFYATLGGTRREVTVLFSDVRGFTPLTEGRDPGEVVQMLNNYLGRMVAAVFKEGGTLDKFIGDAVMAVWGNLDTMDPEKEVRAALQTALGMHAGLRDMNAELEQEKWPPLAMGIGVHHGPAIVGNIGSEERMEPTVIGDTVNLASRLEGLSKVYGAKILASGEVAELAGDDIPMRRLDRVRVKGRKTPVEVWEVLVGDEAAASHAATAAAYAAAWSAYAAGKWEVAASKLRDLLAQASGHVPAATILARCERFQQEPPETWDGAFHMDTK